MVASVNQKWKQQGLSLIELMIALALGLVLTLGVTNVFLGSSKTSQLTGSIAKIQEDLRYSVSTLSREARMAGNYGCMVKSPVNQLDKTNAAYEPIAYDGYAVFGWGFEDTALGNSYTVSDLSPATAGWSNGTGEDLPADIAGNALPGTDILVINSGERSDADLNGAGNGTTLQTNGNSGIPQGAIVLVVAGDCSGGDLFQKTDNATGTTITMGNGGSPGNTGGNLANYDAEASVYVVTSTAYYVGQGANGEPALFRDRLDAGGPPNAVELVEGVESMQVLYGVSSGLDVAAKSYVPASGVSDWSRVVSVRIALLMRSSDNVADEARTGVFDLNGTKITTQSDKRARLVGTSTVAIRNRLD